MQVLKSELQLYVSSHISLGFNKNILISAISDRFIFITTVLYAVVKPNHYFTFLHCKVKCHIL